jgi:hypothetical protein
MGTSKKLFLITTRIHIYAEDSIAAHATIFEALKEKMVAVEPLKTEEVR